MGSRGSRDAVGVEPNAKRRCARGAQEPLQRNTVARGGTKRYRGAHVRPCRRVFVCVVATLRKTCRQQGYEPKRFRIGEYA